MTLASRTSSKFPSGLFLVSLPSLELMVSTFPQACQSWALDTFQPPSAHHILCSHSWAVRHCWRLDAWLPGPQLLLNPFLHFSFLSCSSNHTSSQAHGCLFTTFILFSYPILEDCEAILRDFPTYPVTTLKCFFVVTYSPSILQTTLHLPIALP